jgi:RNA-directed DNA polymerase
LRKFEIDPLTRRVIARAVKTKIGDAESANTVGVPQGLSISGALACLYMLRFDQRQEKRFIDYFRYVDDILIISDNNKSDAALNSAKKALNRLGLVIHPPGTSGKTEITCTEDGIEYLGYHISRSIIRVRKSSFRRMFKNISKVVTDYRYRKDVERFIFRINLKITGCIIDQKRRGWMMFFSRTEDMGQLAHLDRFVKNQLRFVGCPPENIGRLKTFVKSYHEINFNINHTSYIPNFDTYTIEQKTEVVSILSGRPLEEIRVFDIEMLERQFGRLLGKEIRDLEQDVGNPS